MISHATFSQDVFAVLQVEKMFSCWRVTDQVTRVGDVDRGCISCRRASVPGHGVSTARRVAPLRGRGVAQFF